MEIILNFMGYFIPFLIVLTVLVFVHELGHFLVARFNKVKVEVFSIGFGPEIFGWTDKKQTRWKFSLLPFGGYVRMYGDSSEASTPDNALLEKMPESEKNQTLHGKNVWQRIAISAAGPLANYLFTIVLFAALFINFGQPDTKNIPAEIGLIEAGSVAEKAGFQIGDKIHHVNKQIIHTFQDLHEYVLGHPNEEIEVVIARNGESQTIVVKPESREVKAKFGKNKTVGRLGIGASSANVPVIQHTVFSALKAALYETYSLTAQTLKALGQMVVGKRDSKELGGVLQIAKLSGDFAHLGISSLMFFMAVLSLNLGLINLFPVPMLDGGHILFYFIEAIRGKPVSEKIQEISFRIGLVLLVGLMLFSTWNDITRFF